MHSALAGGLVAVCSLWNVAGLLAVARAVRQRAPAAATQLGPVSVLKPLNGADDDLYENLRSFFEQDLPEFQLLFGVTNDADPQFRSWRACSANFQMWSVGSWCTRRAAP